jgi:hypothetical protein
MELLILLVVGYIGFVVGTLVEHVRASKPGHYE